MTFTGLSSFPITPITESGIDAQPWHTQYEGEPEGDSSSA